MLISNQYMHIDPDSGWFVCLSGGDVIMMLPVSRFKGQPVGMVTTTSPWLSITCNPNPHWLWLTSWFQTTPPLVFYPPTVWMPEHSHLIQVIPLVRVTHIWYTNIFDFHQTRFKN